jgi:multimeric flavodoxin WrbA
MPFFDQRATPATPGRPVFGNKAVNQWTTAIAQSDGFIFVTPECNYGISAVLKNAIDWVYPEWNRKTTAFVSYGSATGVSSNFSNRLSNSSSPRSAHRCTFPSPRFGRITIAATWNRGLQSSERLPVT